MRHVLCSVLECYISLAFKELVLIRKKIQCAFDIPDISKSIIVHDKIKKLINKEMIIVLHTEIRKPHHANFKTKIDVPAFISVQKLL